jgi:hypothetical protein
MLNITQEEGLHILSKNSGPLSVAYNDILNQQTNLNYMNPTESNNSIGLIVQSINTNLSHLNLVQNELNIKNNMNQEALLKQEKLLKMKNEDLMKQLRELEAIQSAINNKNRLIDETNQNIEKSNLNIKIAFISIFLAIVLTVAVVLFGLGSITFLMLFVIFVIIMISYVFLFMYSYNIFHFKEAVSYINDRKIARLEQSITNWENNIQNNIQTSVYGDQSTWIENNCSCPAQEEEQVQIFAINQNQGVPTTPGQFYYDGNAPQQLINPEPRTHLSNMNNTIDWVDYDNYTKNSNHYYNMGNRDDPPNMIRNRLDNTNELVGNKTYTTDL